ncbi:MAG: alpha/beta fold hydrolase [Actinomycetota bacterium]
MRRSSGVALATAAAGLAAGVVAERVALNKRRARDTEADQEFGTRRGERSRRLVMPDGAQLFIEESGPRSKRGVIFVHGSALRTDMWHYQMNAFEGRRLLFYDLRGHGLSQPKGEDEYSIGRLAQDLLAVIDDAGLEETVIVGHSVGGMVAQQLCLEHPDMQGELVRGLVLLNTTYGPAIETVLGGAAIARLERYARRPFDLLGTHSARLDKLRAVIKPSDAMFWGVSFAAFGPQASAHQIDFVYDMTAETATDVIFDLIKSYRDFDARERLDEISVPCLVVTGTEDRLTLSDASTYLAGHLPKAELHLLEGVGHMSMMEKHDEVNRMLDRFFQDTLGRRRRASTKGHR